MKTNNNGIYRDATAEEIEALKQEEIPAIEPTPEERIADLEEALELILNGVTA